MKHFQLLLYFLVLSITGCMSGENDKEFFLKKIALDNETIFSEIIFKEKPLLIYFSSIYCRNCRKIEEDMLSDRIMLKKLKDDFDLYVLFVDNKKEVDNQFWIQSHRNNKRILKTVGQINNEAQIVRTLTGSQPVFYITNAHVKDSVYTSISISDSKFKQFLDQVK